LCRDGEACIAEHELPPGTIVTARGETVRLEMPSYLITRPEAEALLLAEWERDQAVAALDQAEGPTGVPVATVVAIASGSAVIAAAIGIMVGFFLAGGGG
jgi:hypothetical protein